MRRLFVLFWIVLLLMPAGNLWARIERWTGPSCSGLATITQGSGGIYFIEGAGVDLTTGLSVSNSSLTATIQQRWNGAQNAADGGNVLWGKIKVLVHASTSIPAGSHYVYINYPVGRDSFSVKVIGKGVITGATVPTFSAPFQSNVDVKLTGTGLSSVTPTTGATVRIISDSFNQLLDAGGQAASGVSVTAQPDTSTNTDTQAIVRLNFSQRLTLATVEITLRSGNTCSGLNPGTARFNVTLKAPAAGPIYVKDHLFDRTDKTYTVAYSTTTLVTVTIRLDRPVPSGGLTPISMDKSTGVVSGPGVVYWAVIPSSGIKQATGGTAYNPAARFNQITVPAGQQNYAITFQVASCPGAATNAAKFVTWKPDPNNDGQPNRKETLFTILCR
ncbi:MAG: hypothetical protein H6Q05_1044 [Acidobacteria bacterium]|jgi:hypothetical protein|nr:hypothetical protein [Acidobacteriota bacterium]